MARFTIDVNNLADQALQRSLRWLGKAAAMDDLAQTEYLRSCKGPGIMCAVAAALPHRYLQGSSLDSASKINMPPDTLEIDMRGRIDVDPKKAHAYIDIGEVKRKLDYSDAIPQLGIRLGTIGWLVRISCNVPPDKNIILVGRIVVPKAAVGDKFVAADQRDEAERE